MAVERRRAVGEALPDEYWLCSHTGGSLELVRHGGTWVSRYALGRGLRSSAVRLSVRTAREGRKKRRAVVVKLDVGCGKRIGLSGEEWSGEKSAAEQRERQRESERKMKEGRRSWFMSECGEWSVGG